MRNKIRIFNYETFPNPQPRFFPTKNNTKSEMRPFKNKPRKKYIKKFQMKISE